MRENPRPYEIYRHFKGNLYQILTLARHSEDGRTMVVYQALYGDYQVYVRSLDMFMSLTDTEKYPEVTQKYRFERIDPEALTGRTPMQQTGLPKETVADGREAFTQTKVSEGKQVPVYRQSVDRDDSYEREEAVQAGSAGSAASVQPSGTGEEEPDLDPGVLEFLDADTYQQKLNILASMKHRITDDMINTLAIASDLEVEPGPIEKRYDSLKNCLLMKDRFEKVRLF